MNRESGKAEREEGESRLGLPLSLTCFVPSCWLAACAQVRVPGEHAEGKTTGGNLKKNTDRKPPQSDCVLVETAHTERGTKIPPSSSR